jgi:3-hydroxy-D-aspartate aldolase
METVHEQKMRQSPNQFLVGKKNFRDELNTPALGVDLDLMEKNMKAMAELAARHGVALRPHGKAHKSSHIAKLQLESGAVGICCATTGEAEVMAAGGIEDILITAPQPSSAKLRRLASLLDTVPRLSVVVDQVETVDRMAAFAASSRHVLTVLIDVDVGQHRTGVTSLEAGVDIAQRITAAKGLKLGGIQGYAGNLQATVAYDERAQKSLEVHQRLRDMRKHLKDNGFACDVVTGVGTGTLLIDLAAGVFTEIQPGSYLYMDAQYSGVEIDKSNPMPFQPSLRFFTRVISAPLLGKATTDGGHKSMPADGPAAPKIVAGAPEGTAYKFAGDEFGRLEYEDATYRAGVNTLIECLVPHCDTSIGVHDHLLCFRGDTLEAILRIEGRGA